MRNGPRPNNIHHIEMDAALAERPPVIKWAKNKRGVMVAVEIHDPHAEKSTEAQAERLRDNAARYEREALELMEDEAREVAERFRKYRADNSPLQAAARNL